MTVVFSAAAQSVISLTADSAITRQFLDRREYDIHQKSHYFPGVGVVATWGELAGNRFSMFLNQQGIASGKHTVEDLADMMHDYLQNHYKPHEFDLDDVGYHVAGFDQNGRPRLIHVFWGFDRPRPNDQVAPHYRHYDHSPDVGRAQFLYNGRNDLADILVRTFLAEIGRAGHVRYDIRTPLGLVQIGDYAARFAAELTLEVGPPFQTYIIAPDNRIEVLKNRAFQPLPEQDIARALERLSIR